MPHRAAAPDDARVRAHLIRDGTLVIGDYLVADEERAAFTELGLHADYEPVSFCAGVFMLRAGHLR